MSLPVLSIVSSRLRPIITQIRKGDRPSRMFSSNRGKTEYSHRFQLPFWALVSFGSYLLFRLGYGVMTFNDVPDAYKELMGQIETAKKELKAKGVTID